MRDVRVACATANTSLCFPLPLDVGATGDQGLLHVGTSKEASSITVDPQGSIDVLNLWKAFAVISITLWWGDY